MVIFDKALQNAEALKRVGTRALEEAKKAGVSVYYMDPAYGNDIIREFPDGRRERRAGGGNGTTVPIQPRT